MARLTLLGGQLHLQSCMCSERKMYTWGHNNCIPKVLRTNIDTHTLAHIRPPPCTIPAWQQIL